MPFQRRPDPNIARAYNREFTLGIQHQLFPTVAITAGWYRRRFYNLTNTFNLAVSNSASVGNNP